MKLRKIIFVMLALIILFSVTVSAAQSTAYTYTISVEENWIRTQDAYIPSRIYLKNESLSNPQDLFVFENKIYVADTGNRRILILDRNNSDISKFVFEEFVAPSGLFVADDGSLYVADPTAGYVFVFDSAGNLKMKIGRPDSVLFGKNSIYQPKKVVVSSQGNIFVVGEGAYEGIMQFDEDGEFQGYFAANKKSLTMIERIEELILSDEQLDSLISRIPRPIQNIDITDRDLIYSVTQSGEGATTNYSEIEEKTENCLKLHNMAGTNILSANTLMNDEWNFIDVASGLYENSYAITYTGLIYEYDSEGNLLFSFGGRALDSDAYGLVSVASAMDIDDMGTLYVLDSERALIQTFVPTEFATLTHKAIHQMNSGDYTGAEETWQSILKQNGMSRIAHVGYGRTLFRQQKYSEALEQFKLAGDLENYSECFWELRDAWLTNNMLWIVIAIFVLVIILLFWKKSFIKIKKQNDILYSNKDSKSKFLEDITFSLLMLRHPNDGYYYLKRGIRGSTLSAGILYILIFAVFILDNLFKAFIFNTGAFVDNPIMTVWIFLTVALLWNLGNYMVSTINAGEGTLKNVYIMSAYALVPYLVITPVKLLLSYILTYNEGFVITMMSVVAIVWSAVLIVIGLMETHNYNFGKVIKNILLTVFAMILAIVAVAILYLIWTQLFAFLTDVFTEVLYIV